MALGLAALAQYQHISGIQIIAAIYLELWTIFSGKVAIFNKNCATSYNGNFLEDS